MGEASPVFPGEWPLTFPRTEGGGRSPPHGGARADQGVVAGKKRKVRRAAVKAVFLPTRQAALPRLPLDPNARRCQGRDERCGPRAGLSAGCAAAEKDKRSSPASAETAAGWLRALRIERGRPERAMAHSTIEEDHRRGETDRYPRGSGKPYGAIGERGFPPPAPLTGGAGSLRPRLRRPHGAAAG